MERSCEGSWCVSLALSLSLLLWPWQVCDPRSEVLHGQHTPYADSIQERPGEVRTPEAPGRWRGRAALPSGASQVPPAICNLFTEPSEASLFFQQPWEVADILFYKQGTRG